LILIATGNNVNFQTSSNYWEHLPYRCYLPDELLLIVETKLGPILHQDIFANSVLKFWAARSSNVLGDYRLSIDRLIHAIHIAEKEDRKVSLKDVQRIFDDSSVAVSFISALSPMSQLILKMVSDEQNGQDETWSFGPTEITQIFQKRFKLQRMSLPSANVLQSFKDIGALLMTNKRDKYRIKAEFL
jgi:Cdc6-like AAA superfamily ATPase